mgnify:CR=1 FL=1|tara:strand:+ start:926 stop:1171 length:246 start_codon:yes stop_codon:yes gene_type:complete
MRKCLAKEWLRPQNGVAMKLTNYAYLSGRLQGAYQSITTHPILLEKLSKTELTKIRLHIINDIIDQDVATENYEANQVQKA